MMMMMMMMMMMIIIIIIIIKNTKLRVLPPPRITDILHELNVETIKINKNDPVNFIVRTFNYLKHY